MHHPSSFTNQEIKDQLNRILEFPIFSNSGLLAGFLSFIVKEHVEGRTHFLKEYTVGVEVLGKKPGYDPKEDASVRIHAGRLRKALDAYYSGPGRKDLVLISMPKGGYMPKFEVQAPLPEFEPAPDFRIQIKPSLAILPFTHYDKEREFALADGLCDQLCTEFTNFEELAVVSYYSSRQIAETTNDIRKAALLLDANYILTGNIRSFGTTVRIIVQLMISKSLQQIWAYTYERERSELATFSIQDDIVRHVVNQIAGSHGIIFREVAKNTPATSISDIKVYDAVYWFYYLVSELTEELFSKALNSMKEAVQLDPNYALGWAILGETYVAGYFYKYDCQVPDPLNEAVRCGKESLKIDPRTPHAYQTLALAYLFLHQRNDCLQIVDRWVKLKSNSAGIAGGIGFCLICAGEYERGYLMLSDSIHLNPYYPWWFNAGLSIYYFQKNEYPDAIYWAEKLYYHSRLWELILKTASYSEMGNDDEAKRCKKELLSVLPAQADLKMITGLFLQPKELVDRIWNGINFNERIATA